jgi:hypothetical protein
MYATHLWIMLYRNLSNLSNNIKIKIGKGASSLLDNYNSIFKSIIIKR